MAHEIAHAANTLARLASKAAASRAEFGACACEQVLISSPRFAAGDVEESKRKDQEPRRCESSGRERHDPRPVYAMCLLFTRLVVVDLNHHFHSKFRVLPVPYDACAGGC